MNNFEFQIGKNNWYLETYRKIYKKRFIYQKNSGGENREAHTVFPHIVAAATILF